MMKFIIIVGILATFTAKAGKIDSTFKTKGGEVITIKGKDTLVAFAGNWRVNGKKQEAVKKSTAKRTAKEVMWDDVVIRKQTKASLIQLHKAPTPPIAPVRVVKKATRKK